MSRADEAEMACAKAWTTLFKEAKGFIGVLKTFFTIPKTLHTLKMWRDVQVAFWGFLGLLASYFVLPLVIQLIVVLRR